MTSSDRPWRTRLVMVTTLLLPLPAFAADKVLDGIVAVVNDGVVLESDVSSETDSLQRQARLSGQRLPEDSAVLRQRVIERLIDQTLQSQRAQALGITVDAASVNRGIDMIARNNRMNSDQLREALTRDGIDWGDFRDDIEQQVRFERLVEREVASRVRVSNQEIDDFLKQAGSGSPVRLRMQHILISIDPAASNEAIAAAEARAREIRQRIEAGEDFATVAARESDGIRALEGGDLGWRLREELPEFARVEIDALEVGEIAGPVRSADGLHLFRLADKRREGAFGGMESRVRHIYIAGTDGNSEAEARELARRIRSGEDFAALAREYSDDPNSAPNGGELPWFTPGQMPAQLEAKASDLEEGGLSDVFQTDFGWHVMQLLERRPVSSDSESVRLQASNALRARKVEQETQHWVRRLRDESFIEIR